ncbi:2-oxoglutarate dehydrogenase E1 component [Bacillaceae bacterium Marseille-Q3522]|nr:2-oxoglutarate dehydrogenase E1 component [Bacillaceae bacterium Marseille-Q3522]
MSESNTVSPWHEFHGPNLGYVLEQYDLYLEDPTKVDEGLRRMFTLWGEPGIAETGKEDLPVQAHALSPSLVLQKMKKFLNALQYAENIRHYGHLEANIYPMEKQEAVKMLSLSEYDLTDQDLKEIPAEFICPEKKGQLSDGLAAIKYLKQIYTGFIGFEIQHAEPEEKKWLQRKIESGYFNATFTKEQQKTLLKELYESEGFEQFIHKTYVGQKRFSVEGLESLVPVVEDIVNKSAENGMKDVIISMAHRGRLNILTHVLKKPYEAMFSEFQHSKWLAKDKEILTAAGWTGDVKYHLGYVKVRDFNGKKVKVTLANNPSHLEVAGAVVEGYARAAQDVRTQKGYSKQDISKALPILIHGDAAFSGQGVVAETFNFSNTKAYSTGGTIHIIANNRIGFTTEGEEDRSTRYSSDLAKGFNVPIFHVNADAPEACLAVASLAFAYRQVFHKDVLIDLIGYRRLGHNEMDEPMATNPVMYHAVHSHPTITEVYKKQLLAKQSLSIEEINNVKDTTLAKIAEAFERIDKENDEVGTLGVVPEIVKKGIQKIDTSIDKATLVKINNEILSWPENFNVFSKLQKILKRRLDAFEPNGKIDWALAEVLAFATILKDGTPIRLTGEDSERGTFSHRNLVLSDEKTGEKYCPLHAISTSNASFDIYNSTLSEGAILGFEYGYNVFAPDTLVLWEAQFGDFANNAQVIYDQFISAGRAKWGQKSGLVILLPHGYEGQGPEHSSARLERYLQLAAENNWTVANLSSSAQYFHILRRQAAILGKDEVRPLVLMTPKSLLRNQTAAASVEEFTNGGFQPVIEQPGLGTEPEKVERIVFCTGRLAVELSEKVKDTDALKWLDIIRVEEIYPFPEEQIESLINKYKNLKEIIWTQEEPKNMGAWSFISTRLQAIAPEKITVSYNGRPEMSSPSEGDPRVHKKEQQRIIDFALTAPTVNKTKEKVVK